MESCAAVLVVRDLGRRRQRLRMLRVSEREVVVLHRDDVREVGGDVERDLEVELLHALVADAHALLHPGADEALAGDGDGIARQRRRWSVAKVESRLEVLDPAGGEEQRARLADAQDEPREEPRVVGEEPARRGADVAALVADAEGGALEDREHQAV